jgi:Copper amine oxidase N-terminal domain/Domain of unknown function (DUF5666)
MIAWMKPAAIIVCVAMLHGRTVTDTEQPIRTIGVFINGEQLRGEAPARVMNGRVYLPMRATFAALGVEVMRSGQTLTGSLPQDQVIMHVGSAQVLVGHRTLTLDAPIIQVRDVAYIPLHLLSGLIGAVVSYDQRGARVEIISAYIGKNLGPEQASFGGGETVTGVVSAVDWLSDPPSVTVVASGAARTINITLGAKVYVEDATVHSQRAGTLDEVHVGDALRALVAKNGSVLELHDFYKSFNGVVAAVSSTAFVLENGRVIAPTRSSVITLNQAPAPLSDLQIGDYVTVRANPESDEIREIIASRTSSRTPPPLTPVTITSLAFSATRPLRADETLDVTMHGTPGGTAQFDIGDVLTGLPMREGPAGTYTGRFTIPARFNVVRVPVYGNLRLGQTQAPRAQAAVELSTSTTSPQITEVAPAPGQTVNTRRPAMYATFVSPSDVGIDPSSISIVVNGHDVTASAVRAATFITYSPGVDLPDGDIVVSARVADSAGNVEKRTWKFTINAK